MILFLTLIINTLIYIYIIFIIYIIIIYIKVQKYLYFKIEEQERKGNSMIKETDDRKK